MNSNIRKCKSCKGTGFVQCPECRGIAFPDDSHKTSIFECDRCKRNGVILCPACQGFAHHPINPQSDK